MVHATLQASAQITLKNRLLPLKDRAVAKTHADVPQNHAQPLKNSKLMVHARTAPLMKRLALMDKHVKLMVALVVHHSTPQMDSAMQLHAQSTLNQML
jgi:hypothetical protein